MEKEEKKADLEQLLNSLIEKGWKPFGFKGEETRIEIERDKDLDIQIFKLNWIIIEQHHRISGSLRNLTSKESGLWQFVCENKLVKTKDKKVRFRYEDLERTQNYFSWYGYEYRLIESALCDEDKLEEFLLQNIKIEGKNE